MYFAAEIQPLILSEAGGIPALIEMRQSCNRAQLLVCQRTQHRAAQDGTNPLPVLAMPHDLPAPTACFTFSVADWTVSCATERCTAEGKKGPEQIKRLSFEGSHLVDVLLYCQRPLCADALAKGAMLQDTGNAVSAPSRSRWPSPGWSSPPPWPTPPWRLASAAAPFSLPPPPPSCPWRRPPPALRCPAAGRTKNGDPARSSRQACANGVREATAAA